MIAVGETATLDETDVDPSELFVAIGMLVLESRLPTASVKGRRDGLHCPQAVGHWSSHECELAQPQVITDAHRPDLCRCPHSSLSLPSIAQKLTVGCWYH